MSVDLDRRPLLVFWETTRACMLACRHCRASAIAERLPGELTRDEADGFLESLTRFGQPYPVLVLTGGDVLMRPDALALARQASALGLSVALAPSVTPLLGPKVVARLSSSGVKAASIARESTSPSP